MYYEEKIIDGVMHWRADPREQFRAYDLKELSQRYQSLKDRSAAERSSWIDRLEAAGVQDIC